MQLRLRNLYKNYGDKKVLCSVDLTLDPGIHALLGPNGAGKSTMMNILAGILPAGGGEVFWDGRPCDVTRKGRELPYLAHFGFLPQKFGSYEAFSGMDFLKYFAALKGLAFDSALREQIGRYVDMLELSGDIRRKMSAYSGGMRQRVGIIQAFLGEPRLLLLDEPTAGLDPKQRRCFKRMLEEIKGTCVILLSTHILSDVQEIADTTVILKEGRVMSHQETGADPEALYMKYFSDSETGDGA
ncbi:MAG: ATP-binding cassette domain-containing protein [Lachnospiraceae bacterium]|nr:ATP-binding cassette domain-containing protein [Lachnospiraceae bacterium]